MTVLYLIRHAENDYLGKKKLAGWIPDIHLNERGVAQAEEVAMALSKTRLKAIYASPLERAIQTAGPIARVQGLEVIPRSGLGEIRYGRWQGKSLKALRRRKLWPIIQHTPSLARFPNGESFTEAQSRVVTELETLRAMHKQPKAAIACVSHADTIKLALAHYIGLPLDLFQRLAIEPASISVLFVGEGHVRLIGLNHTPAQWTEHGK
jgi:probable phosphoglycerate mutase